MKIHDTRIQQMLSEGIPFMIKEIKAPIKGNRPYKMDGGAICLCLEGEAEISINTTRHSLKKGCEVFIHDDLSLFIKRCSEDFRMKIFLYSKEVAFQAMHKIGHNFYGNLLLNPIHKHTEESIEFTQAYMKILEELENDRQNRFCTIIAINLLRSIMLNICDKMMRHEDSEKMMLKTRKEEIFDRFMSLLPKYGRKHRDVTFYADKLCISPRYLGEITRAVAGESPKESIDYYIISEIKLLLTFSDMSVQQIADHMHFPDQSYLGRFFKHHTGISPLTYRTQEMER